MPEAKTPKRTPFWLAVIWFTYFFLVIRTAWVGDDALITMRVIENFVHGYGPVFNIGERVQVFTHPLWFLLLSLLYAPLVWIGLDVPSQHVFFLMGVAISLSGLGMYFLLYHVLKGHQARVLAGLALLLSRGFIDYSTSGLEYPLLFLLLMLWFWRWRTATHPRRIGELAFWFALLITTRMDAGLLVLPLLLFEMLVQKVPGKQKLWQLAWGSLPFLVWEIFSFVYYGFFFPNTFYAKVGGTGLALLHRIWLGLIYFLHTWDHDPVTLFTIGLTGVAGLWAIRAHPARPDNPRLLLGGVGLIVYLGYIIYVGGDFMQSRFFVPALLWAALLWEYLPELSRETLGLLTGLMVMLGYSAMYPVFRPQSVLVTPAQVQEHLRFGYQTQGVADERLYYTFNVQGFALLKARPDFPPLLHFRQQGIHWRYDPSQQRLYLVATLGENGLVYGPSTHLVDRWALADPLLARLPAKDHGRGQRPGHMSRAIPAGYLEALLTGDLTLIRDDGVRAYYTVLHQVIAAPLFSPKRWSAIWALHTGRLRPPQTYLIAGEEELKAFLPPP